MHFVSTIIGSFIGYSLAHIAWRTKLEELYTKKFPSKAKVGDVRIIQFDGKYWKDVKLELNFDTLHCNCGECDCFEDEDLSYEEWDEDDFEEDWDDDCTADDEDYSDEDDSDEARIPF